MRAGRWNNYHRTVRLFLLAWIVLAAPLAGQESAVERGFDHFYNLEYDQALADFQQAINRDPDSPDLHNHLAQTLLFREMYRDGALESELVSGNNSFLRRPKLNPTPEIERAFLNQVARAMALSEARLKQDANDTAALYALGISYGLRANYYWVVKKSWHDSLSDATAARRKHNRITELDPAQVDARLVQGLHDYIVGSLPLAYRVLGFLAGIRGDKEKGIQTIQQVARNGDRNRLDAQVFLCALYRRENQPLRAVPLIEELIQRFPRNFLLRLELSQMYSMAGDKTRALEAVEELARRKASHAPGLDQLAWEKIYFQEGVIQFWYRDLDRALENLKKAAAASGELDLNSGAQTYLRMGQIYDMTQRRAEALEAYKKCIAYAPEADAARESRRYLTEPYRRL
jgi:tetratricopeptide (TPR) repeat protein